MASSAEDAIRVVDASAVPDLVLSDIRMRGLDGMDLLRFVRQRAPASKVVLMTACHDVGTAVRALREGASDFLCKPFDLPSLRAVVGRLLAPEAEQGGGPTTEPSRKELAQAAVGPGTMLLAGRYTLESEVGHGAMAVEYRAHDRRHERDVAVKLLRREVAPPIGVDRFLEEIRTAM